MAPMTITATQKNGERITKTVHTVGELMVLLRHLGVPIGAELAKHAA